MTAADFRILYRPRRQPLPWALARLIGRLWSWL